MNGDEIFKITTDELEKLLSPAHVVGTAIDLDDRTIIPVVEYGFGFGAGTGKGKSSQGGEGSGTGGGGGIRPVALIIIHRDIPGLEGIQVLSLRKAGAVAQAISTLAESLTPQVISAIKEMSGKKEHEEKH